MKVEELQIFGLCTIRDSNECLILVDIHENNPKLKCLNTTVLPQNKLYTTLSSYDQKTFACNRKNAVAFEDFTTWGLCP